VTDPSLHVFWLASRATGVVALALVSISIGLGLAMAARLPRAPGAPARAKQLHEVIALASLIAIGAHGALLLGDSYLHPSITEITIPFVIHRQPLLTGLGIIGGWLAALLGLSFYARRWIGARTWRRMHRWTVAVYLLGLVHAIGLGTDGRSTWFLLLVGVMAAPVAFAATYRYLPRESPAPRRPSRPRPRPPLGSGRPLPAEAVDGGGYRR
jgi:sulfoxide reductase heme-binding subunit YedZ